MVGVSQYSMTLPCLILELMNTNCHGSWLGEPAPFEVVRLSQVHERSSDLPESNLATFILP